MEISFDVPEDIAKALSPDTASLNQKAREGLAVEGYRSGRRLSEFQVMRLLQFSSRVAVHEWLREQRIPYRYSEADLAQDLSDLSALGLR